MQLVERAIKESIDFVVIAGALYDGNWRDFNTRIYLRREMGRPKRAGIRVFDLFGIHDAESELTRSCLNLSSVVASGTDSRDRSMSTKSRSAWLSYSTSSSASSARP